MAGDALSAFRPAWPWRNAHLQSVLGSLPPRLWWLQSRARDWCRQSEQWLLDCGDGVRLQAFYNRAPARVRPPLAVLLHGWEGSADSAYLLSLSLTLSAAGFDVLRLNLRDHGRTQHLNREIFHSCRLPELMGALQAIAQRSGASRLYLAGFSLGGNFMLRAAADARLPATVMGAAAVSPVIDPAVTLRALERGLPIYRRHFVSRWTRSLRRKQQLWPQSHDFGELLRSRDLRAMTVELVQRCTDYPSAEVYMAGYAIIGERLRTLRVPAALLLADDDPLIPHADLRRLADTPLLQVTRTPRGGHCGFLERLTAVSFADRWVLAQFTRCEQSARSADAAQPARSSAGGSGS